LGVRKLSLADMGRADKRPGFTDLGHRPRPSQSVRPASARKGSFGEGPGRRAQLATCDLRLSNERTGTKASRSDRGKLRHAATKRCEPLSPTANGPKATSASYGHTRPREPSKRIVQPPIRQDWVPLPTALEVKTARPTCPLGQVGRVQRRPRQGRLLLAFPTALWGPPFRAVPSLPRRRPEAVTTGFLRLAGQRHARVPVLIPPQ
jgi:hypothetical protein